MCFSPLLWQLMAQCGSVLRLWATKGLSFTVHTCSIIFRKLKETITKLGRSLVGFRMVPSRFMNKSIETGGNLHTCRSTVWLIVLWWVCERSWAQVPVGPGASFLSCYIGLAYLHGFNSPLLASKIVSSVRWQPCQLESLSTWKSGLKILIRMTPQELQISHDRSPHNLHMIFTALWCWSMLFAQICLSKT